MTSPLPARPFALELSESASRRAHERELGLGENAYPWGSLDPSSYPVALVERARITWTETALSEYAVLAALGQMLVAFTRALVPLDFSSQAAVFAAEEARHVELCARLTTALGGAAPLPFNDQRVTVPLDASLSPLQHANELVVRILCVSETLSLPLLTLSLKSAQHPLTRAVLERIVRDEARHGRLGWDYLDWVELEDRERVRLGHVARDALQTHAAGWAPLQSRAVNGVTSEGFSLAQVHELGWAESSAYAACARRTVEEEIRPRLGRHGIEC